MPLALPSRHAGGCLHRFCRGCLRSHIQAVIRQRTYPVGCPQLGCDTSIADAECELLLSAENSDTLKQVPGAMQGPPHANCCSCSRHACAAAASISLACAHRPFHPAAPPPCQVMAEASIPEQARFYCPNRRCSAPFPLDREPQPDTPSFCPACDSKICTHCRVVWHKGFRCAEYQVGSTGKCCRGAGAGKPNSRLCNRPVSYTKINIEDACTPSLCAPMPAGTALH